MSPRTLCNAVGPLLSALLIALSAVLSPLGWVEIQAAKPEGREFKREMALEAAGASGVRRDKDADARGNKPRPDDAAARSLAKLREHLEVTDDAEWEVIAERITKLAEVRNSFWKGSAAGRGGPSFSEKGKKGSRPGASAYPDQDALRSAVRDNLTDAEIKVRLDRTRVVFQQNEARLAKAQAELRAVLTVRQEAVAVLAGLLPP